MKILNRIYSNPFFTVFDEPAPTPVAAVPTTEPAPKVEPEPKVPETFTQDEVNTFMKKEKEKIHKQLNSAVEEIEMLKQKSNLTQKQRTELDDRLETLKNEMLTKDQRATKDKEKILKQHSTEIKTLTDEKDKWQNLYADSTIQRGILDAAITNDAIEPEQIVAIMRHDTRINEELDESGEPTGRLIPVVKFQDKGKDGKNVELDIPVHEAVKRMKEMDKYFNLFNVKGSGGMGTTNRPSGVKQTSADELARKDPQAYILARKEGKLKLE